MVSFIHCLARHILHIAKYMVGSIQFFRGAKHCHQTYLHIIPVLAEVQGTLCPGAKNIITTTPTKTAEL